MQKEKVVFIYNQVSGKGLSKLKLELIISKLKNIFSNITLCKTVNTGDAKKYAARYTDYDLIIVLGGDGTINDVISAIMDSKYSPKIAIIPNGTMNDFARNLGLNKNISKSIEYIKKGHYTKCNILKVNNTYATYGVAMGRFSSTSYNTNQKLKKIFGKLSYFLTATSELFKFSPIELEILHNKQKLCGKYSLCLICNSSHIAGFKMKENIRQPYLILVKSTKNLASIKDIIKLFVKGIDKISKNKNFEVFPFDRVCIKSANKINIVIDGERHECKELEISVQTKQLSFVSNK